ncbi:MAG: type II 3-dehydroquinate dehydratase [Candidatus Neomarinimicrobiota bacterium]
MRYLVIHGPNLNLLGRREPEIYGHETLEELNAWIRELPDLTDDNLIFYQSNHEGDLLDCLHAHMGKVDGAVINPGALAHTSYALRDAIAAVDYPVVEVHLSDINKREPFRKVSLIKDVCVAQIVGQGKKGYLKGLKIIKKG